VYAVYVFLTYQSVWPSRFSQFSEFQLDDLTKKIENVFVYKLVFLAYSKPSFPYEEEMQTRNFLIISVNENEHVHSGVSELDEIFNLLLDQ